MTTLYPGPSTGSLFHEMYVEDTKKLAEMMVEYDLTNCKHDEGIFVTVHYFGDDDHTENGGGAWRVAPDRHVGNLFCMDCEQIAPIPMTWGVTHGTRYTMPTQTSKNAPMT